MSWRVQPRTRAAEAGILYSALRVLANGSSTVSPSHHEIQEAFMRLSPWGATEKMMNLRLDLVEMGWLTFEKDSRGRVTYTLIDFPAVERAELIDYEEALARAGRLNALRASA